MLPHRIEFREIDVDRDGDVCIRFREDAFIVSFGCADQFYERAGPQCRRYLHELRQMNRYWPGSCVHVWLDEDIVGQLEIRRDADDPEMGFVTFCYLTRPLRGSGLAKEIEEYVDSRFRDAGVSRARLRVSPENKRAVGHYSKHGWRDRGPDPDHPNVHLMEKIVPPAS